MIKIIRYSLVVFSILSFSLKISAQVNSFTLKAAISYAENNHKGLKNAQLDIELANNKVKEILAIGLPQISSDIKFQNFIQIHIF